MGPAVFKTSAGRAEFMADYDAGLARWPVPFSVSHVPTRFGATYVVTCGPRSGPLLVLFHATGTGSTVWLRNVAAVSHRFRTYLVDTIDEAGKSEWSAPPRTRTEWVEWVAAVLDGLGIDRAHLGGMSRGGWMGLNFVLAAPRRVRSLSLLAPMGLVKPSLVFLLRFL